MKKRTWRWVSRDCNEDDIEVWVGVKKPVPVCGSYLSGPMDSLLICLKEWKKLFGFVPKPGECLRVEFSARVIKE